jgi:hypothetical protein
VIIYERLAISTSSLEAHDRATLDPITLGPITSRE